MILLEVKAYLGLIRKYDKMIANKLSEYVQINSLAYSICVGGDSERVQTSGNNDKVGNVVSKMVDIEAEIDVIAAERKVIVKQIESIEDEKFYDVLAKRFILGMDNQEIAYEYKTTPNEISRTINDAALELEKKFNDIVDFSHTKSH